MRFGIEVIPFGPFSDPRLVAEVARIAEEAGWEAIALWDHLNFPASVGDPWVTLSAVAAATTRMKLITGVAPLPRYRPHLLARTLTALDVLSGGRVIFGTGLGVAWDMAPFGDPADDRTRAAMTDEGLELLARLWSGEAVTHHGAHYTVEGVAMHPQPVQQPRIPVWIGGDSRPALRRAARWDGWIIGVIDEQRRITKTPEQVAEQVAILRGHRADLAGFAVAVDGTSEADDDGATARAYERAGATWWLECIYGTRGTVEAQIERLRAGPPR
jgi:alkanesulfonate monooxygenase SsuD/methylene tetrahydromethanopterin reductase-like flavin-dependent oxidoreductase (luciferase family)